MRKHLVLIFLLALAGVKGWGQTNGQYTSAGTFNNQALPSGATSVTVEIWGAGGGGGGYSGTNTNGGGGAGGGYIRTVVAVPLGVTTYSVIVGAGGAGGSKGNNGSPGGISSFTIGTTTISAVGGNAGGLGQTGSPNGAGGAAVSSGNLPATGYVVSTYGGAGANGGATANFSGGGGSSAGTSSNGNAAIGSTAGAAVTGGGAGGAGVSNAAGTAGTAPGGGGSGAGNTNGNDNKTGGAGGVGKVVVTACPSTFPLTSTTASPTNICNGSTSTITLTSSSFTSGNTYAVTYNISTGGVNTATGLTANLTSTGTTTGTFVTNTITNPGTSAATYTVTVTGITNTTTGCVNTLSAPNTANITVNPSYSLNSTTIAASPICNNTAATVTLSSPTLTAGTYTVTYDITGVNAGTGKTATMTVTTAGSGTFTTSALATAGTSNIVITNIAGATCSNAISANNTANVVVNSAFSLSSISATTPVCNNSAATITLNSTAAGLPVGNYTVTYNITGVNAVTGKTVTVNVTTAGTGSFSTGALATAGTSTIAVTNISNGTCTNAISTGNSTNVVVNAAFALTSTTVSSPICNNSTATVTVANTTASVLPVGTYTVTYNITGANAATGLTASMNVASAGTGTFTTGTLANAGTAAATSTVVVTNIASATCSNAISANNSATVTINPSYSLTSTTATTPVCNNTAATVTLSSPTLTAGTYTITYDITGVNAGTGKTVTMTVTTAGSGSFTSSALATAGTSTITITNISNGTCGNAISANNTASVVVNPAYALTTTSIATSPICNNSAASVTLSDATLTAGTYTITYDITGVNATTGKTATMTIAAGNTSGTFTTIALTTAGTSTIKVTNIAGASCGNTVSANNTANVTVNAAYSLTSTTAPATTCNNSAVTITVANTTTTVLPVGTYTVTYNITGVSAATNQTATMTVNTAGTGTFTTVTLNNTGATAATSTITVTNIAGASCNNAVSSNNTATVTVNQTYKLTSTSAPSSVCINTAATVTLSDATLTAGTYTVTYDITGANAATGKTATMTVSSGSGTFTTSTLGTAGSSTINVTNIAGATCSTTISANNSANVTVNPLPTVAAITGTTNVGTDRDITLQDATTGGTWSINNTALATIIGSTTANPVIVHGVKAGSPMLTYTVTQGTCSASQSVTIIVSSSPHYYTHQAGNYADVTTWDINKNDGNGIVRSSVVPTNDDSVTIQHDVALDQNYAGTSYSTFAITAGSLTIQSTKSFSSAGKVDFGGNNVTVKSDASGTGAIGTINGSIANATNVTVERYIGVNKRAWQLLTAPVTGTTINAAWQEGQVSNTGTPVVGDPNYGTLITGHAQRNADSAYKHGYDFWTAIAQGSASILRYSGAASTGIWDTLPGNGLSGLNIETYPAYLLFVRGNRATLNTGAGTTTLRATGTLKQGSIPVTVYGSDNQSYSLVGNPYASPIDFDQVYNNGGSNVIKQQFTLWNSHLGTYGAYQVVSGTGSSYTVVPNPFDAPVIPDSARYIPSGAGFFVQPTGNSDATFNITELSKAATKTILVNPFRLTGSSEKLYVNLNIKNSDTTAILADGLLARFSDDYSAAIDVDDVRKQANLYENLGISSSNTDLIIEARPGVVQTDTIQLKLWNVGKKSYQLQLKADSFDSLNMHAWLEDSYLKTKQPVSLNGAITTANFTVTSDSGSYKSNRFRVVFINTGVVLPVTLKDVKAAAGNGGVNVNWTVANEVNIKSYAVERSIDGGKTFAQVATVPAKNTVSTGNTSYSSFDALPKTGDNLYRIRMESKDGKVSYSGIVLVTVGATVKEIQISMYPNPVKEGKLNLQLSNLVPGTYVVNVYGVSGQVVYQRKITIAQSGSIQQEQLLLGKTLAQGSYQLQLTDANGTVIKKANVVVAR